MKKNQSEAMKDCLLRFLNDFNLARYAISNPVERLEKYFGLFCDKNGVVHISLHTKLGDVELWETSDIDLADLQNVICRLKNRAKTYLRFNFNMDA